MDLETALAADVSQMSCRDLDLAREILGEAKRLIRLQSPPFHYFQRNISDERATVEKLKPYNKKLDLIMHEVITRRVGPRII